MKNFEHNVCILEKSLKYSSERQPYQSSRVPTSPWASEVFKLVSATSTFCSHPVCIIPAALSTPAFPLQSLLPGRCSSSGRDTREGHLPEPRRPFPVGCACSWLFSSAHQFLEADAGIGLESIWVTGPGPRTNKKATGKARHRRQKPAILGELVSELSGGTLELGPADHLCGMHPVPGGPKQPGSLSTNS